MHCNYLSLSVWGLVFCYLWAEWSTAENISLSFLYFDNLFFVLSIADNHCFRTSVILCYTGWSLWSVECLLIPADFIVYMCWTFGVLISRIRVHCVASFDRFEVQMPAHSSWFLLLICAEHFEYLIFDILLLRTFHSEYLSAFDMCRHHRGIFLRWAA